MKTSTYFMPAWETPSSVFASRFANFGDAALMRGFHVLQLAYADVRNFIFARTLPNPIHQQN